MYKRQNSTKVPKDTTVSSVIDNVQLKEGTSLYSPTFILSTALIDFEYGNWNYLKWYDRYYFIDDRIKPTIQGAWTITCTLDLLATFKEQILDSYAFVLYSTNKYDVMIPDGRLSYPNTKQMALAARHGIFDNYGTDQAILLQYISAADGNNGAVAYAVLTTSEMFRVNRLLMNDSSFLSFIDKQLNDTASAIVGCKLYPFTPPVGTERTLNIAGYDTDITGKVISSSINYDIGTEKIPIKGESASQWRGDFRDMEPYTTFTLFLPTVGYIDIPGDYIQGLETDYLIVNWFIDFIAGSISYNIDGLGRFDGCIAVNIPTAYSGINAIDTMRNIGGAVAGAASLAMGNVTGAFTAIGSAFNAIVSQNQKSVGTIGASSGNRAQQLLGPSGEAVYDFNIALYRYTLDGPDPSIITDTLGRPYNKVIKLSECSGYVQTTKASVELASPKHIMDKVNNLLDSGIYIE